MGFILEQSVIIQVHSTTLRNINLNSFIKKKIKPGRTKLFLASSREKKRSKKNCVNFFIYFVFLKYEKDNHLFEIIKLWMLVLKLPFIFLVEL